MESTLKSVLLTTDRADNPTSQIWNTTTDNESAKTYDTLVSIALILLLCFAIVAAAVNLLVLVASKFTTAGRHSILVFIRSLCVADTLIGFYGIAKYIFVSQRPQWINCFLPDALLICAFVAGNFTFVALLSDCCNILYRYLMQWTRIRYSKYSSIFLMIYLWNSACIFAFLPQMGWNNTPYTCAFFEYHSVYYLVFLSIIFFISVLLMIIYTYRCRSFLRRLHQNPDTPPHIQLEVKKMQTTIHTSHLDIGAQIISFLPLIIYILLHCNICVNASAEYSDSVLLLLLPIILVKSIIAGIVRGKRTTQIYQVIWKKFILMRSSVCFRVQAASGDGRSNSEMLQEISVSQTSSASSDPRVAKMSDYRQFLVRQRRAHSVASVGNGLLNAAALATATPITRKQRFMCSKCGHLNHINLQPGKVHKNHPSENVHSWKKLSSNSWKMKTPPYTQNEDQSMYIKEQDTPHARDRVKLKQLPKEALESFQSSFSTEESVITDHMPRTKHRAQSIDSGMGPSILSGRDGSTKHKDSINKGRAVAAQQKVVTFNDAIFDDIEVFVSQSEENDNLGEGGERVSCFTTSMPERPTTVKGAGEEELGSARLNPSIIEMHPDSIGQDNRGFVMEDFHDPDCVIHGGLDMRLNDDVNKKTNLLELRL